VRAIVRNQHAAYFTSALCCCLRQFVTCCPHTTPPNLCPTSRLLQPQARGPLSAANTGGLRRSPLASAGRVAGLDSRGTQQALPGVLRYRAIVNFSSAGHSSWNPRLTGAEVLQSAVAWQGLAATRLPPLTAQTLPPPPYLAVPTLSH
jgi:hypothetical protein